MYFAYGWPKVAFTDLPPGDTYVYLKATEKFLFAVSRTRVQLWSGGLHRIKLSECVRTEEDVKQEGVHIVALWSPVKATLAILTAENYLHLYAIHAWKDNLVHPSSNIALKDIQKVDIYLKSSIRLDSEFRAMSLAGDHGLLLIGFADGTIASLSWSGKMKEVAYPLDDATDLGSPLLGRDVTLAQPRAPAPNAASSQPGASSTVRSSGGGSSSAFAAAASSTFPSSSSALADSSLVSNGYGHSPYNGVVSPGGAPQVSRAIAHMSYCEYSKQVVMVMADGACAVCGASEGGLSPLTQLCFGRWLCGPAHQAVCAQVGARAQLIAVGRDNGEVELYRLHRTGMGCPAAPDGAFPGALRPGEAADGLLGGALEPPVRTLSLESWGHKVQQTGAVAQVEWSPDGRAIAVAYTGQGVVVWSPSGCRLMCSLRQPAPSGLSTFPSAASRGVISHQTSLAAAGRGQGQGLPSDAGRSLAGAASFRTAASVGQGLDQGLPPHVPLDGGISAVSWGPMGYQLAVAEVSGGTGAAGAAAGSLLELMFAHSLPGHHRVARGGLGSGVADEEVHVLLGHDRLLLIREAGEAAMGVVPWAGGDGAEPTVGQVGDLAVSHVPVPHSYVASNWPLQRSAVSASGSDIAVSGRNGLAVYNRTLERWRLFGDISQERQVSCRALGWLSCGVLVACSGPDPYAPPSPSPPAGVGPLGVGVSAGAPSGPTGHELLLLPRYHLDLTSLLARHPLQQPPLAVDCLGSHILLASEPLEITLLEVTLQGELSPTGTPRAIITTLREISMFDVGRHISDVALVPLLPVPLTGGSGGGRSGSAAAGGSAVGSAPRQCVLLRWGGLLSVLDLEKGAEVTLATEVEAFWLSDAITCQAGEIPEGGVSLPAEGTAEGPDTSGASAEGCGKSVGSSANGAGSSAFAGSGAAAAAATAAAATATLDVEMPWWLYGPAGMQLCFPSSLGTGVVSGSMGYREGHDIELEFDQEVYPVGISLADDAIVGITQRIVRGPAGLLAAGSQQAASASQLPCFHPIPESQPVLPCLLRRLLQRGAFQEAVSLARRHARGPHFARSLEWLLFTALEIDTNTSSLVRPAAVGAAAAKRSTAPTPVEGAEGGAAAAGQTPPLSQSSSQRHPQQSLLASAADLVRHFPTLFAEVVVSVARKTDAALWPPLFDAVGSPSRLLDGLVEAGELASAACFLLIIDRLEGAHAAQAQALRLMRDSLLRGLYPLCCELLRFVVPPSDQEPDGRALVPELSFGGAAGMAAVVGSEIASEQPPQRTGGSSVRLSAAGLPAQQQQLDASSSSTQMQTKNGDKGSVQQGPESQPQDQQQHQQQGGRTWLGWLLGYSTGTTAEGGGPEDSSPQEQPQTAEASQQPAAQPQPKAAGQVEAGSAASGGPAGAASPHPAAGSGSTALVRQTLALLGEGGGGGGSVSGRTGSLAAPGSPALAQLLMVGAGSSVSSSAGTTASAKAACKLVAEHAWRLLESGHLAALGQLVQASSFLPGGLAGLMMQHRDSPYASRGYAKHTALELLSSLAVAVAELPVWSSEQVEQSAVGVEALCRQVGAVAWAVAMAVLLVDAATVTAFRRQQPAVWAEFVQMLHADSSFSYLWDIVEVLSDGGDGGNRAAAAAQGREAGAAGAGVGVGRVEGGEEGDASERWQQEQEGAEEVGLAAASQAEEEGHGLTVVTALPVTGAATGLFAAGSPTASVGLVELRTISVGLPGGGGGGEIEEGPRTPLSAIPGPQAGEVSIARG